LIVLDFTLLPNIDSMSIFSTLPEPLDRELGLSVGFDEFHQRAKSALMFFGQLTHENEPWQNEALLRSGLNEFYSLNDALRRALKIRGIRKESVPGWEENPNPLLQLMSILRGVWVHAAVTSSTSRSVDLILRSGLPTEETWSVNVVVLCDDAKVAFLESGIFKPKKNGKKVTVNKDQFEFAIDWLLEKQNSFGVAHLFKIGVEMYCEEALKLCNAKK